MVSPSPEDIANDLIEKTKNRPFYSGFLIKSAIVRTATGPVVCTSIATASYEAVKPRESHDYGPLLLEEQWYSKDQFLEWVTRLSKDMKFGLSSGETLDLKGSWQGVGTLAETYLPSNYPSIQIEWPSNFYRYALHQNITYPPQTIPSPIKLPLFPNGGEAVEWWLGVRDIARTDFYGRVIVMLPNFRARISTVVIGSKKVTLSVEKRQKDVSTLARVFSKDYRSGTRTLKDQDLDANTTDIEVEPDWTFLKLALVDKKTGELLDFRDIQTGWSELPKGVKWEAGADDLLEIIRRGEDEEVEFKESLTKSDDIVKTVVAFANTRGGVLLIGVNDECQVVGLKEDPATCEGKIRNWLRDGGEPPIQVDVRTISVVDQKVVAVLVNQSSDKPCWVREKGPYVRYGANNRLATRAEVQQMLRKDRLGFVQYPAI